MPARVIWDTRVTPRDRVGQVAGRWLVACGQFSTPLRMPGGRVAGPRGRSLAPAKVARMCVYFKRAGENSGSGRIGGKKWGRNGGWCGVCGDGWDGAGNGWRGRVTLFSGVGERMGSGVGKGVRPGGVLGRAGNIGSPIRRTPPKSGSSSCPSARSIAGRYGAIEEWVFGQFCPTASLGRSAPPACSNVLSYLLGLTRALRSPRVYLLQSTRCQ